ncbi:MAG: hypothetical protein AAB804_03045 [Patescibacteria group bacterium]
MRLSGNVHLVAGGSQALPSVLKILGREGISVRGNPDLYVREYRTFGVDEARSLRERASLRPVHDRRVFIVVTPNMTNEAQNALLKTLEEPPANALFFFIVPAPETLLSTLRSRAHVVRISDSRADEGMVDVPAFFAATPQKRLDMLRPLLEKDEDDPSTGLKTGKRDMGKVIVFLESLERAFAKNVRGLHTIRREGIESIYRARKYIADKGALLKPLLEQIALLTPRV